MQPLTRTWPDLVRDLGTPYLVQGADFDHKHRKLSVPQFLPGEYRKNPKEKGSDDVACLHLYVLDVDGCSKEQFEALQLLIESGGLAAFLHTTYTHAVIWGEAAGGELPENPYRCRVIFPLSRPVATASEWKLFWANCRLHFLRLAHAPERSFGKVYLAPSCPAEYQEQYFFREFSGVPIDVDAMLGSASEEELIADAVESKTKHKIHVDEVLEFIKKARRRKGGLGEAAGALQRAYRADPDAPYCTTGGRENTLWSAALLLAGGFPGATPESLAAPFAIGIRDEVKNEGPTVEDFIDKIRRAQEKQDEQIAKRQLEEQKKAKRKEKEAYSVEDAKDFVEIMGGTDDVAQQLIISHRDWYYFYTGTGYSHPVSKASFKQGCSKFLQGKAESLGFELYHPREEGEPAKKKSIDDLCEDYGTLAANLQYHLGGVSYFDTKEDTLNMSLVKSCPFEAERVPEVDAWIDAFTKTPEDAERLRDWMAQAPNTDFPICALMLVGPASFGKSKFAEGMSLLWGREKHSLMDTALGSFNFSIARNPLVLADESFPRINGQVPTDKIRSLISSGVHALNEKGLPLTTLRGYLRCVGAMNPDGFYLGGLSHSKEDADAISKRFLFIFANEHSEEAPRLFKEHYKLFVDQGGLAKHSLWLATQRQRGESRFGIETGSYSEIILSDGGARAVLTWLSSFILSNYKVWGRTQRNLPKTPIAFLNKGRLFVHLKSLGEEWDRHLSERRFLDLPKNVVQKALKALALYEKGVDPNPRIITEKDTHYWQIDTKLLRRFVVDNELELPEVFDAILGLTTPLEFKTATYRPTSSDLALHERCKTFLGIETAAEKEDEPPTPPPAKVHQLFGDKK